MTKIILQVALFRWGIRKFEEKVNKLLEDGYQLDKISVEKKGFKIICLAIVKKS